MPFQFLLSTRAHDPVLAEAVAMELGFDGVELVMQSEELRQVRSYGSLRMVRAIHAPVVDFVDVASFRGALDLALKVAAQLNVSLVNIHPGALGKIGHQNVVDCIRCLQERARSTKRTIAYEVLPAPHKPKHKRQMAYPYPVAWLADVKKYHLPATLDTTHIASWGEAPQYYVSLLGDDLAHVHVSDYAPEERSQHLFLNSGTIAWAPFFDGLRAVAESRTIYITLEQAGRFNLREHEDHLTESLGILRKALR